MAYQPYDTPDMAGRPASELASPWVRLVAWIIVALLYFVVAIVALIVTALVFEIEFAMIPLALVSSLILLLLLLVVLLVVFIVQAVLLVTRGQTIGKIIMKIRIVDAVTGQHPGWARLILLRTIVNSVIISFLNILPGAGGAYFLVDSLFIFRENHRTIHDLIAGTRVDKVSN